MAIQDKPKYEFPKENLWSIGEGTYKVFIPKIFNKEFKQFCKKNKFIVKQSSTYNYAGKRIKGLVNLKSGMDFFIKSEDKDEIRKWLVSQYKELK